MKRVPSACVVYLMMFLAVAGCESQAQRERINTLTSQVEQLRRENADLQERLNSLTRENEDLRAQLEAKRVKPTAKK